MDGWVVAVVVVAGAAGAGIVAWAVAAGRAAWRRSHRAPVLDQLTRTWQPW
jgi:hypothetical protein